ncbi:MAG: galactose oxidase-like domain-containing protein, partial [Stellaceae bacterium]
KTSAGAHSGSDGYGPFDDYDIGSKDQEGTVPTRFGSREQLQRCVAMLRANGLDVYLDMVEHHRSGDPGNFVFRYKGAEGKPGIGRFPKDPLNFVPNVPRDPNLGGPARDDFPFGRELAPINAKPKDYVFNGLIDAADWLTRALDIQGYRLDDVKGLSTDFLFPFLTSKSMAGKFAFGEFFDGNRTLVNGWVFNPHGMRGRASAFDFPLRFILAAMCNNPGRFNMADLDHAGLAGISPLNAVTFVENHDTDLNEPVAINKLLGYAYILTSEGYPSVYYRDYSTDKNCFGLKQAIDNLIWIHEKLAVGSTQERWKDFDVFAYERLGHPGLLVALNNDPAAPHTIEVATAFGANTALHDYTGHGADLITTNQGTARITVPRNADDRGYVCYSRIGIDGGFAIGTRAVTQEFEGAADLDLPPAENGKTVQPGRIWCDRETPIRAFLDLPGLAGAAEATLEIAGPDGPVLASRSFNGAAAAHAALEARTTSIGFHALRLKLDNASEGTWPAYKLAVSYTASKELPAQVSADAVSVPNPMPAADKTADPKNVGQWDPKFSLPNVAIHTHLLPNGKVLFWGRRDHPTDGLDEHFCTPQIWDPATRTTTPTPKPTVADGRTTVNLFCSGHTFLPDGRLLVAGGHFADSKGIDQASIYDYRTNTWTSLPVMNSGRWYPTVVILHDGTALVMSGSFAAPDGRIQTNEIQEVWDGRQWRQLVNFHNMPLFPRVHAAPNGRVFMSGPLAQTYMLDTNGPGNWIPLPGPGGFRDSVQRDYAPSVMYDVGKIIFVGGGNEQTTHVPTAAAEIIDLTAANPAWRPTAPMHHPRRQHNATILPDGTVLVTGGTKGGGGKNPGFNDLTKGEPVHVAELWDPMTGQWTLLAAEEVDRCYHATAILLPDATVLSAGGGEYRPDGSPAENPPQDSHRDGQIFHPPYLFRGPRPDLTTAPQEVAYGQSFTVGTSRPEEIGLVNWIRLSSVTHSFNMDQRINFLAFRPATGGLTITAPEGPDVCPPGHYMLFLLSKAKVPSIAKILRIAAPAGSHRLAMFQPADARAHVVPAEVQMSTAELDAKIIREAPGTRAAVGLTSRCPYGLGACWGGAYEALQKLDGVQAVRPIANAEDSTADVYLHGNTLPNVDRWAEQITRIANGSYDFRGVEVSVKATVQAQNGGLGLTGASIDKPVALAPLEQGQKIQFDRPCGTAKPATAEELNAYQRLLARYGDVGEIDLPAQVTGPLRRRDAGWVLHVRDFEA